MLANSTAGTSKKLPIILTTVVSRDTSAVAQPRPPYGASLSFKVGTVWCCDKGQSGRATTKKNIVASVTCEWDETAEREMIECVCVSFQRFYT